MDDLDEITRNAEHITDDLGEHGLMALAVIVRAGEHGDVARGIDADIGAFEQAAARAKLARYPRGCQTASLDIGDDADAAQLAAPCRLLTPSGKT